MMTICIAAICEKGSGLILAADSMLTNAGLSIQFEHPTRKMTRLSDSAVALTAGDALAHTELFNMVQGEIAELKAPTVLEIVNKIKKCYQLIREGEINETILMPRGFRNFGDFYHAHAVLNSEIVFVIQSEIDRYNYGLQILVAGMSGGTGHIYGISDPGTSKCFDAIGFNAIGSGLPHAINTLIARECNQEVSLEEGLLIVYEAKKMAEKAPGVGANITDICIMTPQKTVEFPRDKLEQLNSIYDKWVIRETSWASDLGALLEAIGV